LKSIFLNHLAATPLLYATCIYRFPKELFYLKLKTPSCRKLSS